MINEQNLQFCKEMYEISKYDGRVSKVGLIFEDDSTLISSNTSCHAGLYELGYNKQKKIKGVFSVAKPARDEWSKEGERKFVDWMVNHSPYAMTFLSKDPDLIIGGCYISDPNIADNFMVNGSIATRFLSEGFYKGHGKLWEELVNNGADGTHAYGFCQVYGQRDDNLYPIAVKHGDAHTGTTFSTSYIGVIKNFVNGRGANDRPSYQESRKYVSMSSWWKKNCHVTISFSDWAKKVKPKKVNQHMSYNIFDQQKKKVSLISDLNDLMSVYDQFVEEMKVA